MTRYEQAVEAGEGGAFLRREGLYSSLMSEWRRARDAGLLPLRGRLLVGGSGPVGVAAQQRDVPGLDGDLGQLVRVAEGAGQVQGATDPPLGLRQVAPVPGQDRQADQRLDGAARVAVALVPVHSLLVGGPGAVGVMLLTAQLRLRGQGIDGAALVPQPPVDLLGLPVALLGGGEQCLLLAGGGQVVPGGGDVPVVADRRMRLDRLQTLFLRRLPGGGQVRAGSGQADAAPAASAAATAFS